MAQSCMMMRTSDSKAIADFAKAGITLHTNTITVNKRKLHYVFTGNDTLPTIVFIHGSPGSWDAFAGLLKDTDLLSRFRMFSIDRPGFGYSDFGNAMNLEDQSLIMAPLFQKIKNNRPVYLVGHSLGGPMIIQLEVDNPGVFSALVILAGSVDPGEEKPERWRKIFMGNPLEYLVPGALRPSNKELWYLKKDLKLLAPRMKEVNCDVHIIHGTKDQLVPYGNMAYAVKSLINVKSLDTISIPGANHFIPWTHYEIIKSTLLKLR
jgi:pimeloyl-ACP methyl ester carboxylesterase